MNPYDGPPPPSSPPLIPAPAEKGKEPFSHQAAKFSAYTPFLLMLLGLCLQGTNKPHEGTDTGWQLAVVLGTISVLTTLTAFVFGCIGLGGGIVRRAAWTIVLAIAGIVVNSLVIAISANIFLLAASHKPVVVPDEPADWQRVTLPGQAASVEFPGPPQEVAQPVGDHAEGNMTSQQFHSPHAFYAATAVQILPAGQLPGDPKNQAAWLDERLGDWRLSLNGSELDISDVTSEGLVGRQIRFVVDSRQKDRAGQSILAIGVFRGFVVGRTFVPLGIIAGKSDYENNAFAVQERADKFFASLRAE
jgi:hypothetical protein